VRSTCITAPASRWDLGLYPEARAGDRPRTSRESTAREPENSTRLPNDRVTNLSVATPLTLSAHQCSRPKASLKGPKGKESARSAAPQGCQPAQEPLHLTTARRLAKHRLIVTEDPSIKHMTASGKGTVEEPGKNVKRKAGSNSGSWTLRWGRFSSPVHQSGNKQGLR
jgi:hypothetical protein